MNHRAPEALPFPSGAGRGGGTGARLGKGGSVRAQRPLAASLGLCFSFASLSANARPIPSFWGRRPFVCM